VHNPNQGTIVLEDWYLRENSAYYHCPTGPELQDSGLEVIPYTFNDAPTIRRVIDLASME